MSWRTSFTVPQFLLFAGSPEAPCIWTHPDAQIQLRGNLFQLQGLTLWHLQILFSRRETGCGAGGKGGVCLQKVLPGFVFAKQAFHMWSKSKEMKLSFRPSETPGKLQCKSPRLFQWIHMHLGGEGAAKGICCQYLSLATEHEHEHFTE